MKLIVPFFTLFVFTFCSSPESKTEVKPIPKKEIVKKKPKVVKKEPLFNDENVEEKLLAYGKENTETVVLIKTSFGDIKVRLFKDTPMHRANFIMLAKANYFDSTIFSRVVPNFMAQAGSGYNGRHTDFKRDMGAFTIPAEIKQEHFHRRGAVAMAREYRGNPDKRSSPYAFYFVEGTPFSNETLDIYEKKNGYTYSTEQRNYYTKKPGAAHIDGEHTVFGEIISGYDVVPKLTAVDTDGQDWPRVDIFILKVEVLQ